MEGSGAHDARAPDVAAVIDLDGLGRLIGELRDDGFAVMGPVVRDGAIVIDEIASVDDLPAGWGDDQRPGHYRLRDRADGALFGHVVGADSWRRFLTPPDTLLLRADGDGEVTLGGPDEPGPGFAALGIRGCDLAALAILGTVLDAAGEEPDRVPAVVVAVDCTEPAGTCFCPSFGTGPAARAGYDLALTEIVDAGDHHFVVRAATTTGEHLLARVPHRVADADDRAAAAAATSAARSRIHRHVDLVELPDRLAAAPADPRWDDVADRCLGCGSCTLVCPTCYCATVVDTGGLDPDHAERTMRWDSCFAPTHSELNGIPVRPDVRSRYRQWLTHKLGTWVAQHGTSGCVGCGRCLTWCPAGIDLTAEVAAVGRPT